jgi:hypothetical protein
MTCEHGQILMTINNLYMKVTKKDNMQLVTHAKKSNNLIELTQFETRDCEQTTLPQLAAIKLFAESYCSLLQELKAQKDERKRNKV